MIGTHHSFPSPQYFVLSLCYHHQSAMCYSKSLFFDTLRLNECESESNAISVDNLSSLPSLHSHQFAIINYLNAVLHSHAKPTDRPYSMMSGQSGCIWVQIQSFLSWQLCIFFPHFFSLLNANYLFTDVTYLRIT